MTGEPWRYACPEGHRAVYRKPGSRFRCKTCDRTYDGEPIDLKHESLPEVAP